MGYSLGGHEELGMTEPLTLGVWVPRESQIYLESYT